MSEEAKRLLQAALLRCFGIPAQIGSLRTVLEAGVGRAVEVLANHDKLFVEEFYGNQEMFTDAAAFEAALPREALAKQLTDGKVRNATLVAGAASLVFTHATVDAVALDCCRAITMLDPTRCADWVGGRSVKLADVMVATREVLLRNALDARLEALERESLLDKVDFIYRTCRPGPRWTQITGYSFDRDRLVRVDGIRHESVHGLGVTAIDSLRDGDEKFLEQTSLHLVLLTVTTFGIKFDPAMLASLAQPPGQAR